MFHLQIKEFLNNVCEQIKYKPIRSEISEELENHIKESKENYIIEGLDEKVAEEKAIKQMGDAEKIGKKLNKIHKPKINVQLLILAIILLEFSFLVSYIEPTDKWKLNLITIILSMIPCVIIYFFNYRKIKKYSNLLYGIATIILLYSMSDAVRNNSSSCKAKYYCTNIIYYIFYRFFRKYK